MIHSTEVLDFTLTIHRKAIKSIYIRVDAADGSIRVSAPKRMPISAVKAHVLQCEHWIRAQQAKHAERQASRPYQNLVTGESIPLWGVLYPLEVVVCATKNSVMLCDDRAVLLLRGEPRSIDVRLRLLNRWYREQLWIQAWDMIRRWEPTIGVSIKELTIRSMKTLWGSCNITRRRICLNRELVKLPLDCLEGVIVHEMTHLHEPRHNRRFYQLMTDYLPDWRVRDARLQGGSMKG